MMNQKKAYVINLEGRKEPFSFRKVYRSARRVGASRQLAQQIARTIEQELYSGIKTVDIFRMVRKELLKQEPRAGLKFNLKQGMRKLGPTGFPFEKYVGAILSRNGFKIQLNQYIPGSCCSYEIDFVAKKDNLLYIGECKYRNSPGEKIHLDVALANYARFLDIQNNKFFSKFSKNLKIKSLLVTNTKLTTQATHYSECVGVECLGWNYPKNKGLERLIDEQELYPITILSSLKNYLAQIFVSQNIVLVEDVLKIDVEKFSKRNKIPLNNLLPVIKEAQTLLGRKP